MYLLPYSFFHCKNLSTFAEEERIARWDGIETTSSAAPRESASRRKLRRYDLKIGDKEIDLLRTMMQNEEEMDGLILDWVKEGPKKLHFHVEVGMIKVPTV